MIQENKVCAVKVLVVCVTLLLFSCTPNQDVTIKTVYEAEINGERMEFPFTEDNILRMTRTSGVDDEGFNYYRYNIINNDEPTLSITVTDTTFGMVRYFTGSIVEAVLSVNGVSYKSVYSAEDAGLEGTCFQLIKCDKDEVIANFRLEMEQIQNKDLSVKDTIIVSSGRIETKIDYLN